jgi:DNA-binding NarL/FixJ family response regulator
VVNRNKVRVAIAEDHPAVRKGVRKLLENTPGIVVVGEADDGQEAIEIVEETDPDVLILDIMMPVMDGIEVIENLRESGVDVLIVVLSAIDDPLFMREILALGACSFILKGDTLQLIQAVRNANQGICEGDENRASSLTRVHSY